MDENLIYFRSTYSSPTYKVQQLFYIEVLYRYKKYVLPDSYKLPKSFQTAKSQ